MQIPLPETKTKDEGMLPLINIVFLMLIFFLIAGAIVPVSDFEVNLAETRNSPATNPPSDAIYVSEQGFISIAGQDVTGSDLTAAMIGFAQMLDSKPLKIVADRKTDSSVLMSIVDAATRAGIARVKLLTLRGPES